MMSYISKD